MVKKIFILGDINKKLSLPFLVALSQILINIHSAKFPEAESNQILETFSSSIGKFLIIIVPYIFKASTNENKEKMIQKKKCLHYFLLCLIYIINIGLMLASSLFNTEFDEGKENVKNPHASGDFFKQGLELICIALISIFLLQYKYYLHNYISIAAFIIFGLITDVILNLFSKLFKITFASIIIDFIVIITDSIWYCYQKYLMEKYFYPYWNIVLLPALTIFVVNIIVLLFILIFGKNSDIKFFSGFYSYFNDVNIGIILGKHIINIILNFFAVTFTILTLFNFTPDYVLISNVLSKIVNVLMDDSNNKYYFLIFAILQVICLFFYLEVFEFNFCGLNKNTRRNIRNRSDAKFDTVSVDSNFYEVSTDYFIKEEDLKHISTYSSNRSETSELSNFPILN